MRGSLKSLNLHVETPSIYCIIWVRLYEPATVYICALLNCLFLRISFFSNLLTLNKYK